VASIIILGDPGYDIYYSIVDGRVYEFKRYTDGKWIDEPMYNLPKILRQLVLSRYRRGLICGHHACTLRFAERGYITLLDNYKGTD